jgi:hypothetical protein
VASYIQQQKSSSISTILSEGEIALLSGQSGIWLEAEGRGTSLSLVTEINQRTVVLICHGELTPFDEIAVTLAEIPSWISLLTIEPSPGFKPYLDEMAGIAVLVPNRWVWNQVIPGKSAILQSYPEGKYIGGETFQPLDMKCDFTIHPPSTVLNSQLQIIKSDTMATIISESELIFLSGENGIRLELDSMGRSLLIIAEVNARVVTLTCFGDLTGFDEIAVTLHSVD